MASACHQHCHPGRTAPAPQPHHAPRPARRRTSATSAAATPPASSQLPTCHLSPLGRTFEFPHKGSSLLWARSTGLKLWPGAVLLSRCIAEDAGLLTGLHPRLKGSGWRWRDKLVLELGCGLGLVACSAAWLGARVVATDGDGDLLRVSAKNIAHNTLGAGRVPLTRHPVRTAQLLWGNESQLKEALYAGSSSGTNGGSNSGKRCHSSSVASTSSSRSGHGITPSSTVGTAAATGSGAAAAAAAAATTPHAVADAIVMSDVVYGSDPGLWEKLVATLSAACDESTLLVQAETKRVEGVLYYQYWHLLELAGLERRELSAEDQLRVESSLAGEGQWAAGTECGVWVLSKRSAGA